MEQKKERIFEQHLWENLPADCGILYSWIWNSPIDEELIRRQIDELHENGVRGFYIIPEPPEFRPATMKTAMTPPYLTKEFLRLVRYAAEYGTKTHGMCVWLYDEAGWPSGSANGEVVARCPDSRAKRIGRKTVSLSAGCPLETDGTVIAAFLDRDGMPARVSLPYTAERDCNVTLYYAETVSRVLPYLLDNDAVQAFLDTTYERYAETFGEELSVLTHAMFTDEAILQAPFWLRDPSGFEKETGYVFADMVPALFGEYLGETGCAFRVAYNDYCTRLFAKRYAAVLGRWCREHGIAFTGHMDGDHALSTWRQQGGEALVHLRHMGIPGVDVIVRQIFPGAVPAGLLSGEGENTFFPRLASSAAHQTGKRLAVSESFAVYGDGLTPAQMRWVSGYQFVRGINVMNVMSVTSGRTGFLSAQCRPHFIPELPTHPGTRAVNDAVSRMMLLMQRGNADTKEALYRPMRDVWAQNPEKHGIPAAEESYLALGRRLEAEQHDFDLADEELLRTAIPENGVFRMGDAAYTTVYLPQTVWISAEAVKNLNAFLACGGTVYTVSPVPGLQGGTMLPASGKLPGALVRCDSEKIRVRRRSGGGERLYCLFCEAPETDAPLTCTLSFDENKPGYLLNPDDASVYSLAVPSDGASDGTSLSLTLCPGETRFILFTDEPISAKPLPERETAVLVKTLTDFSVTPVERTVFDGSAFSRHPCGADEPMGTDFSGTAEYRASFAWDGVHDLRIVFPRVLHTARVSVNGREEAVLPFPPFTVRIPKERLSAENTLSVLVANTAADTLAAFDASVLEPALVGPYHEKRTSVYERDSLGIGIPDGCLLYAVKNENKEDRQ